MPFNSPAFAVPTPATCAASALNQVATYYGQGAYQPRLSTFCLETSLDIINVGFVNVFPDVGLTGWPQTNFGNQCDGSFFMNGDETSGLLANCHQIMEDIPICQNAGKKVFLSLGGSAPAYGQFIANEQSAHDFADWIWGAFGPNTLEWENSGLPRPFGDVVFDGFDFDIEWGTGFGYGYMANRLRSHFNDYRTVNPDSKNFYLSAAPQCYLPGNLLTEAIQYASFDYIWVQFYNNPSCSANTYANGFPGFNFDEWVSIVSNGANPDAKLFVGLPAEESQAIAGYYIDSDSIGSLVNEYMNKYPKTFGGVMLWEATGSYNNTDSEGLTFSDVVKAILVDAAEELCPPPPPPPPPTTTVASTTSSSSSTKSTSVSVSSTLSTTSKSTPPVSPSASASSHAVSSTSRTVTPTPSSRPVVSTRTCSSAVISASSTSLTRTPTPSSTVTPSVRPSSSAVIPNQSTSTAVIPVTSTTLTRIPTPSSTITPSVRPSSSAVISNKPTSTAVITAGSSTSMGSASLTATTYTATSTTIIVPGGQSSSSATSRSSSVGGQSPSGTALPSHSSGYLSSTTLGLSAPGGAHTTGLITSIATATATATGIESSSLTTTIVTTTYVYICPTGFATSTITYTETYCPCTAKGHSPTGLPSGWTTTVTVCTVCGPRPTIVTLTIPAEVTVTATAAPVPGSSSSGSSGSPGSPGSPGTPGSSGSSPWSGSGDAGQSQPASGGVVPGVAKPSGRLSSSSIYSVQPTSSPTKTGANPAFTNAAGRATFAPLCAGIALVVSLLAVL